MKKLFLSILLCILLITGCSSDNGREITVYEPPEADVNMISVEEVKNIVDNYDDYENVTIIDIRKSDKYNSGHIEGAISLPLDTIENIDVSKENKIIVYCQSGVNSNSAVVKLNELGYENVFVMGGIDDWPYEIVN